MRKEDAIRKIREMDNGIITLTIEDGEIVSTSIQRQDMDYREG